MAFLLFVILTSLTLLKLQPPTSLGPPPSSLMPGLLFTGWNWDQSTLGSVFPIAIESCGLKSVLIYTYIYINIYKPVTTLMSVQCGFSLTITTSLRIIKALNIQAYLVLLWLSLSSFRYWFFFFPNWRLMTILRQTSLLALFSQEHLLTLSLCHILISLTIF